jgi:hypothetical protein
VAAKCAAVAHLMFFIIVAPREKWRCSSVQRVRRHLRLGVREFEPTACLFSVTKILAGLMSQVDDPPIVGCV